jgi:hypothetical protein
MEKFEKNEFQILVSSVLRKIADRVEKDDELAEYLYSEVSKFLSTETEVLKSSEKFNENNRRTSIDLTNLFSIYSRDGKVGLQLSLEEFSLEELKKMISTNGLDPSQKARRWKTKDKVIKLIADVIEQKMSHGNAFMDFDQ